MEVEFPKLGEKFPEIKVKTTHGEINIPKDYDGKWFVLFSHPADFTPCMYNRICIFSKAL